MQREVQMIIKLFHVCIFSLEWCDIYTSRTLPGSRV